MLAAMTDAANNQLARLVRDFDAELADEFAAVLEAWARQTEQFERDGSINPRGGRPSCDYRELATEFRTPARARGSASVGCCL